MEKQTCESPQQCRKCAICHEELTDYNDIVPDHRDAERDGRSVNKDRCQNLVIESDLSDVESL